MYNNKLKTYIPNSTKKQKTKNQKNKQTTKQINKQTLNNKDPNKTR